jgi:hypothetical protein
MHEAPQACASGWPNPSVRCPCLPRAGGITAGGQRTPDPRLAQMRCVRSSRCRYTSATGSKGEDRLRGGMTADMTERIVGGTGRQLALMLTIGAPFERVMRRAGCLHDEAGNRNRTGMGEEA